MKRTIKPRLPQEAARATDSRLSPAERAELWRQGAKAAARGEPVDTNPLSESRNKPPATGESADTWVQRSDAWEQGHDAQTVVGRNAESTPSHADTDEHD